MNSDFKIDTSYWDRQEIKRTAEDARRDAEDARRDAEDARWDSDNAAYWQKRDAEWKTWQANNDAWHEKNQVEVDQIVRNRAALIGDLGRKGTVESVALAIELSGMIDDEEPQ